MYRKETPGNANLEAICIIFLKIDSEELNFLLNIKEFESL